MRRQLLFLAIIILISADLMAVDGNESHRHLSGDTTKVSGDTVITATRKEKKEGRREMRWTRLKNSQSRLYVEGTYVFATLKTSVNFYNPGSILRVTIGLEDNLDLPHNSSFFSGALIYRLTPASGIYINYYGFNRSHSTVIEKEIYWDGDTISIGAQTNVHFKTHVASIGYILSILDGEKSYLGVYFNVYVMPVNLGLETNGQKHEYDFNVVAPLPNIGLLALFSLTKWLMIGGNIGFFSIYTNAGGGYINDMKLSLLFRATKWLSFNLNYQDFYVFVKFPTDPLDTSVNYDFKGPALGVAVTF